MAHTRGTWVQVLTIEINHERVTIEATRSSQGQRLQLCLLNPLGRCDGHIPVTFAASDTSICIHDQSQPLNPIMVFYHHKDGVTTLALNPSSSSLAFGFIDHSIKFYTFLGNFPLESRKTESSCNMPQN